MVDHFRDQLRQLRLELHGIIACLAADRDRFSISFMDKRPMRAFAASRLLPKTGGGQIGDYSTLSTPPRFIGELFSARSPSPLDHDLF